VCESGHYSDLEAYAGAVPAFNGFSDLLAAVLQRGSAVQLDASAGQPGLPYCGEFC
jgi:hypothetical protein